MGPWSTRSLTSREKWIVRFVACWSPALCQRFRSIRSFWVYQCHQRTPILLRQWSAESVLGSWSNQGMWSFLWCRFLQQVALIQSRNWAQGHLSIASWHKEALLRLSQAACRRLKWLKHNLPIQSFQMRWRRGHWSKQRWTTGHLLKVVHLLTLSIWFFLRACFESSWRRFGHKPSDEQLQTAWSFKSLCRACI